MEDIEQTIDTKQKEERKKKQKNVQLYPKYKMLSWDMLFYYAISFLFFTETKGISAADVLLAESLYPLFKVILLIPATILIDKIRKEKKSYYRKLFCSIINTNIYFCK